MPRRGFGKGKGGYKGPLPGPREGDAEGERPVAAQKPAKRPPLTHFLCLPLVTTESRPQLQASLAKFKENVLRQQDIGVDADPGEELVCRAGSDVDVGEKSATTSIPEKAIRPVGTLHFTLGVMSLQTPELVDEATSLLQSLDLAALLAQSRPAEPGRAQPGAASRADAAQVNAIELSTGHDPLPSRELDRPLVICLKSLVSMHSPARTSILYAEPDDPTGRLYSFCNALKSRFVEKGLLVEDSRPLKLHATVVNTIYAKAGGRHGKDLDGNRRSSERLQDASTKALTGTSTGHGPKARAPIRIDATALLPKYANFVWADGIHVGKVAICKMGAKKTLNDQGMVVSEEYEQIGSAEI